MPIIHYVTHDGERHTHEVKVGLTVMQGAVHNNVPGILAECGGACACATCQVFVEGEWREKVTPVGDMEASMLDDEEAANDRRLSCQLRVTDELDGLVVRLPTNQR